MTEEPTEELIATMDSRTYEIERTNGLGLDKNARMKAEREQREEADRPKPLNPQFPYRVVPFDPIFVRRRGLV